MIQCHVCNIPHQLRQAHRYMLHRQTDISRIPGRAAVTFDLLSGLRRAELLGLRWTGIDFDTDTITIRQTSNYLPKVGVYTDTPKNETSARRIKLAHSLFLLLGEYRAWQNKQRDKCGDLWQDKDGRVFTSLFGSPFFPDRVTGWFKSFIRKHNFPDVHFHSLRHTYASLMIADGTPLVVVSRRLGHAQVSTTSNIYVHVIQSADEKAAQISDKFADSFLSIPPKNRHKKSRGQPQKTDLCKIFQEIRHKKGTRKYALKIPKLFA